MNYDAISNVKDVTLAKGCVITSLREEEIYTDDDVFVGRTNELQSDREELGNYFVEIEHLPEDGNHTVPDGYKFAFVQEMKGYFLYTPIDTPGDDGNPKMFRMYHDYEFFCYSKDKNMNINDLTVPEGHVLLDVTQREKKTPDGVIIDKEAEIDPRELDLQAAVVIRAAPDVKDYQEGDLVFFSPHSGSPFRGVSGDSMIDLKAIPASNLFFKM